MGFQRGRQLGDVEPAATPGDRPVVGRVREAEVRERDQQVLADPGANVGAVGDMVVEQAGDIATIGTFGRRGEAEQERRREVGEDAAVGRGVGVGAPDSDATDNQLGDEGSVETQEARLQAFYEAACGRRDTSLARVFREEGASGKNLDRPQLQEMLAAFRAGQVDVVMVTRLDRLSRSLLDFYELHRAFEARNVQFVSLNESFDTSQPIGRAVLKLVLVFAELEREQTADRTRVAMQAGAERGLWNGGAPNSAGTRYFYNRFVSTSKEATSTCSIGQLPAGAFEDAVLAVVRRVASGPVLVARAINESNRIAKDLLEPARARLRTLQADFTANKAERHRLLDAIMAIGAAGMDTARDRMLALEERGRALQQAIADGEGKLGVDETRTLSLAAIHTVLRDFDQLYPHFTPGERRELLHEIIDEVRVHRPRRGRALRRNGGQGARSRRRWREVLGRGSRGSRGGSRPGEGA